MICPKCKGTNTKRISTMDPNWMCGRQRCLDCGHQSHWLDFCPDILEQAKANVKEKNKTDK